MSDFVLWQHLANRHRQEYDKTYVSSPFNRLVIFTFLLETKYVRFQFVICLQGLIFAHYTCMLRKEATCAFLFNGFSNCLATFVPLLGYWHKMASFTCTCSTCTTSRAGHELWCYNCTNSSTTTIKRMSVNDILSFSRATHSVMLKSKIELIRRLDW